VTRLVGAAALAAALLTVLPTALAGADSFTPIVMTVKIAPVARNHKPLTVTVGVTADPGVLDIASAPLRIRVKLASECGGEFHDTVGTVLVDKQLKPQPTAGQAYSGTVHGSGKPSAYGAETVCVFLEEQGDNRQFATDTSTTVSVSHPCTSKAAHYDAAGQALKRAQRRKHGVAVARRKANAAHRAALKACGKGVPL
jgi:hypothetical protein